MRRVRINYKYNINYLIFIFYSVDNEDKIKIIEAEFKKENLSKNITGLKLQNNKNSYNERNAYYEKYSQIFKNEIDGILGKFDGLRDEENKYQKRWEEVIKGLKGTA